MKINLNIDDSERQRILEMHNSEKKIISEQGVQFTFPPESLDARKFIIKKFGLFKSGTTDEQQIQDLKNARAELTNYDMNKLVQEALDNNVSSASTLSLQNALIAVSGNPDLKFISDGLPKNFADGRLGTNTAAAWIDYQLYLMSRGKSTTPPSKIVPVEPGSAKPAIKPVYKVGG